MDLSTVKMCDFSDLNYSIHVFDKAGNRLTDVSRDGVKIYDSEINISVCKEIGQSKGWAKEKIIYASKGLLELIEQKK